MSAPKKIIEDYIEEVSRGLAFVASTDCQCLDKQQKIEFFQHCQKAFGQPAMMFSGGATLGLFHTGVCKALLEQDLMPKGLSGSSAGAIMTAMLGRATPAEMLSILNGENSFHRCFSISRLSWRSLKGNGGLADVKHLKNFLNCKFGCVYL